MAAVDLQMALYPVEGIAVPEELGMERSEATEDKRNAAAVTMPEEEVVADSEVGKAVVQETMPAEVAEGVPHTEGVWSM